MSKPTTSHGYGPNGYAPCINSYEITVDGIADCEMKIYDALEYLNKPASPAFVAKQVGRLQAVMARRSESNEDIAVVVDTYTDHLAKYPPDVVAKICWDIAENHRWFPLIRDMVNECESLMRFRKTVWQAFQQARNPVLAGKAEAKRIAADPRLAMHYKEIPRKMWLEQHYKWWVGDAENMAKLHRDGGRKREADVWKAEAERRSSESCSVGCNQSAKA